jgi:predicted amidohydrolase YtcJ
MRTSTTLAVLSALCAIAAAFMPEPSVLLSLFFRRGGWRLLSSTGKPSSSSTHPFSPEASQGAGGGCPLGFGNTGANGATPSPSSSTAPLLERRTWYVGAGGGWTGAVEEDEEGPLWLERGGGFAVDGAGDVAEVAATQKEAAEAVRRDKGAGLLVGPPVDLKGAFVLPGFVDPHVHLIPAGLALTSHADLREAASREEFEARVAAAARRLLRQESRGGWDCSSDDSPENLPWLLGGWWDESRWAGPGGAAGMPTSAWIDAALERAASEEEDSDNAPMAACLRVLPVLLSRMDAHMAVANRAALRRALLRERERRREEEKEEEQHGGVAAEGARELLASAAAMLSGGSSTSSQPTTTRFVDASTGLVREAGLLVVARAAPAPTLAARRAALAAASARLLSAGITAVGDMGRSPFVGGDPRASWDDLEELYDPAAAAAVAEAEGAGRGGGESSDSASPPSPLQVRISAYLPLETWPRLAARVAARGAVTGPLHAAGVKCFWDGSLGSRTALMTEPYDDDGDDEEEDGGIDAGTNTKTKNRGVRMVDSPEQATRLMVSADAADLQPAVHAIGDAAVDEATAALAAVAKTRAAGRSGSSIADRPPPLRLEHVQHISGPDAPRRLAELDDVVAVINPQHLVSDAKLISALSPGMRAAGHRRTHPWRSLLRAGVPLAIGSDWPIVDLDPWAELWAAVHRKGLGERSGEEGEGDDGGDAALTAEEAVRASTAGAAYAAGLDAWCGRLVPGLKADFVLLDGSPFEEEGGGKRGERLLARARPRVRSTFVGGVCRHGCGGGGGGEEESDETTTAART